MVLANGERLGPYEIVAPIGAGGMGEVYRARDTRLGRTVAVKILPAEFASDAKLRIRFEREAKTISTLSHPNICALHDVGPDYLVMEYCEGKTLAQRIAQGPLPIEQVIDYGMQIAGALDKAHRAGIVHRDLKPSNIIVTKSGVKLLDFGLAKQSVDSSPEQSTVQQVTEEGKLLGTVQYMAPELFSGKEADARSDIFALGLILYEMATGKPAFVADSKAKLIAAILEHEPPHVARPALEHILRLCLAKDPDERWQTAHDLGAELRWMREAPAVAPQTRGRTLPWLALAAVLTVFAAVLVFVVVRPRPVTRPLRLNLQPPPGVRIPWSSAPSILAISPDGAWVAFVGYADPGGPWSVYLRATNELDARLISKADAYNPFFSPDSKWLGYVAEGGLFKVPVTGGEPQRICAARQLRGASWSTDGTILFSQTEGVLLRVSADGGQPVPVTRPRAGERHFWPAFLPDGKQALFEIYEGDSETWHTVAVVSTIDGAIHRLVPYAGFARYVSTGQVIYDRLGRLYARNFDLRDLRIRGEPKLVLDDVHFFRVNGYAAFDISANGSLVYIPGAERLHDAELVWVDRHGNTTPVIDSRAAYEDASLSPDGSRIAVSISTALEDADVWVLDLHRSVWTRLTRGQRTVATTWTPDGKWVIYQGIPNGRQNLFRIASDGSGQPEALTSGTDVDNFPAVSPDGKTLLFGRWQGQRWSIRRLSLEHPGPPQTLVAISEFQLAPSFSPDGRWIAYESDESGSTQIHVRSYPGPGPGVRVSTDEGSGPHWSRNGREILFRKRQEIWSVPVQTTPSFRAGQPVLLFHGAFMRAWDNSLDTTADGTKFLMIRRTPEEMPERRLVYVPNWLDEVKQAMR